MLNPGDYVAWYDMSIFNFNESNLKPLKGHNISSDIILVKKLFPTRRKKVKARNWTLNSITKDNEMTRKSDLDKARLQYEEFLRDIEEDPEMRSQIQLYKTTTNTETNVINDNTETDEEIEPDFPEIKIEELMDKIEEDPIVDKLEDQ